MINEIKSAKKMIEKFGEAPCNIATLVKYQRQFKEFLEKHEEGKGNKARDLIDFYSKPRVVRSVPQEEKYEEEKGNKTRGLINFYSKPRVVRSVPQEQEEDEFVDIINCQEEDEFVDIIN